VIKLVKQQKTKSTKLVAFLYTSNKFSEREMKAISLTIAKKLNTFEKIQPRKVKDIYNRNYKTLLKGIEKNAKRKKERKRQTSHAHGLEEIILLKCQISVTLFRELGKIRNSYRSTKDPNSKAILNKKEQC
jgi:hypothetical protein